MNELSLFAGTGGGILGGKILGWRCVCAVEFEPYCQRVLVERQNDGTFEPFPIWDDVRTFHGAPWRGVVDVVSGGFPCQDISAAGKRAGIEGERSGLWGEMARIIGEVRPRFVFVENSPMLVSRGLTTVLSDLAQMGYDARWGIVGAHHTGAPHKRDRIWIVAHTNCFGWKGGSLPQSRAPSQTPGESSHVSSLRPGEFSNSQGERCGEAGSNRSAEPKERSSCCGSKISHSDSNGRRWFLRQAGQGEEGPELGKNLDGEVPGARGQGAALREISDTETPGRCVSSIKSNCINRETRQERESSLGRSYNQSSRPWDVEPELGRVADGVANRSHRLKAIGNGQVPAVVAAAWRILSEGIE